MKKMALMKLALLFLVVSVIGLSLLPVANECMQKYPGLLNIVNIVLMICFFGGLIGAISLFVVGLFIKKNNRNDAVTAVVKEKACESCEAGEKIGGCFLAGKGHENGVNIETYWVNGGEYEEVTIKKDENGWYVCSVGAWPVFCGASSGGYTETRLDEEYFKLKNIKNVNDFLNDWLTGNLRPCIEKVLENRETVNLINEICGDLYVGAECDEMNEICLMPLCEPSHSGETEHGFNLVKMRQEFYFKHLVAYAEPGGGTKYDEKLTKIPEDIKTKAELFGYMAEKLGSLFRAKQEDDQTLLAELFGEQNVEKALSADEKEWVRIAETYEGGTTELYIDLVSENNRLKIVETAYNYNSQKVMVHNKKDVPKTVKTVEYILKYIVEQAPLRYGVELKKLQEKSDLIEFIQKHIEKIIENRAENIRNSYTYNDETSLGRHHNITNITKCYFSLSEMDKVREFLCDIFPDDVYLGYSSIGGMGDVSFIWIFVSKDGLSLTGIDGISYYGGDIGLSAPKTVGMAEKIDINNTQKLNELVQEHFGWISFKKD